MDPSAELKSQIAVLFIYILIQFVRWYYSSIWQCVFFFFLSWKSFKGEKQYHSKKLLIYRSKLFSK